MKISKMIINMNVHSTKLNNSNIKTNKLKPNKTMITKVAKKLNNSNSNSTIIHNSHNNSIANSHNNSLNNSLNNISDNNDSILFNEINLKPKLHNNEHLINHKLTISDLTLKNNERSNIKSNMLSLKKKTLFLKMMDFLRYTNNDNREITEVKTKE